jgi:hypothetical protein
MSTIAAKTKKSERNRGEPKGRNDGCAPPANHSSDNREVYCSALRGRT